MFFENLSSSETLDGLEMSTSPRKVPRKPVVSAGISKPLGPRPEQPPKERQGDSSEVSLGVCLGKMTQTTARTHARSQPADMPVGRSSNELSTTIHVLPAIPDPPPVPLKDNPSDSSSSISVDKLAIPVNPLKSSPISRKRTVSRKPVKSGAILSTEDTNKAHTRRPLSLQFADFPGVKNAYKNNPMVTSPVDDESNDELDDSNVRHWKYHALKYSKDIYLTTNPDQQHISMPVGPSYYVDVAVSSCGEFQLTFNQSNKPTFRVVRRRGIRGYSFEISVEETKLVYTATDITEYLENGAKCEQYSLKMIDSEWIVGNLPGRGSWKVSKNKVYFYKAGDSSHVLAAVRRRLSKKKRVLNLGMPVEEEEDDDADMEKIGWIYVYDRAVQQPNWMWSVVVGLTFAVAYGQRLDGKRSLFK
jgi:hypothetical protein